jgi:hypothetical protein
VDDALLEGDYLSNQRDLMQQQEQDELLERLARRMGEGISSRRQKHVPRRLQARQPVENFSEPNLLHWC